jgi:hypothetical protein
MMSKDSSDTVPPQVVIANLLITPIAEELHAAARMLARLIFDDVEEAVAFMREMIDATRTEVVAAYRARR